jgi:hypothetical protein
LSGEVCARSQLQLAGHAMSVKQKKKPPRTKSENGPQNKTKKRPPEQNTKMALRHKVSCHQNSNFQLRSILDFNLSTEFSTDAVCSMSLFNVVMWK